MKICLILVLAIVGTQAGGYGKYGYKSGYGGYKSGYGGYGYRNGEEKQEEEQKYPETVTPEGRQKDPEMEEPEGRQKEPETETPESARKTQNFREPLPRGKDIQFTHQQGSESNEFKWHESSSSSSEEQTNQDGGLIQMEDNEGCHCWHRRCYCHHESDSEEPTNPTKPDEDSDEKDMCHYCIHAHCFPAVCKHNHCCQNEASQNASDTSVSALVNAALGQLKAGNTLKFNVNIKNPQAIIDEAEALKGNDVSEKKHGDSRCFPFPC